MYSIRLQSNQSRYKPKKRSRPDSDDQKADSSSEQSRKEPKSQSVNLNQGQLSSTTMGIYRNHATNVTFVTNVSVTGSLGIVIKLTSDNNVRLTIVRITLMMIEIKISFRISLRTILVLIADN